MSESPRGSVFCCDLRSKKYFLLGRAPQQAEDYLDASRHCWCARTGETLGPDSQPAHPEECHSGRACFRPFAAHPSARQSPS